MFSKRKGFTAFAAITGISLALAGCSGGGDPASDTAATFDPDEKASIDFAFWGNDVRAGFYQQAFDLFEEEYPNVTVNPTFIGGFPEYWEKRQIEAAGGDLPDVMQFDYSYLRQYGENNLLLNLEPYFGNTIQTDPIPENVLGIGVINDETIALPTGTNAWSVFVNTPLLESLGVEPLEDGISFDDFDSWMEEVSQAGDGTVYGGSDYTRAIQNFELLLRSEGKNLFSDEGEPEFTEEDLTTWWEHGQELIEDGIAVPQQKLEEIYPKGGIGVGASVTEVSWDNFGPSYASDLGVDPETLDIAAPPVFVEGEKDLYQKPALLHAVSASTEYPEAATLLVDFLINSPEVGAIFGTSRGLPASETQLAGVSLGVTETRVKDYEASIADRLGDAPPVPIIGFGSLEQRFKELGGEIALGTLTVDEAVAQFFDEIDTIANS